MDSQQSGKFIAQLRKEKQLTQNDLADLLQVTNKAVSRWETGEGYPDVSSLVKLASILNVTVDELLAGKKVENIRSNKVKLRFENTSLIIQALIVTSSILFLTLSYITFKIWVGFLGFAIPSITSVVWFIIEKNRFISESEYTNEDRYLMNGIERRIMTELAVTFSMVIVQFYWVTVAGDFVNSVMRFESFLPNSILVGFVTFLGITGYYSRKSVQLQRFKFLAKWKPGRTLVTILLCVLLLMTYSQTLNYNTVILLMTVLLWTASVIFLLKHKQPVNFLFASILPVLAVYYSGNAARSIGDFLSSSYIIAIITVYLCLAIIWIQRFVKKHHDVWYWISYQTLGLGLFYTICSAIMNWLGRDAEVTAQYLSIYALVFIFILIPVVTDLDQFTSRKPRT